MALLLPLIALGSLVAWKQAVLTDGRKVTLPITGFDPRDLLSGNYLRYQVVYGVEGICSDVAQPAKGHKTIKREGEGYVCLEPPFFEYGPPPQADRCRLFIKGSCEVGRFRSGLGRYYIPAQYARSLERAVLNGEGAIKIAISSDGRAVVEALFINGKPWLTFIDSLLEKKEEKNRP